MNQCTFELFQHIQNFSDPQQLRCQHAVFCCVKNWSKQPGFLFSSTVSHCDVWPAGHRGWVQEGDVPPHAEGGSFWHF